MKKILIFWTGFHSKVILSEIIHIKGYKVIGFIDENLKKETAEKDRIRRFLREKDLKKHLKGKSSIGDGGEEESQESLSKDKERAALEEDLEKDSQLRHAVSLLSGWDVMVGTLKSQGKNDGLTPLTLGQAHWARLVFNHAGSRYRNFLWRNSRRRFARWVGAFI